jgi:WD40 repeat protein
MFFVMSLWLGLGNGLLSTYTLDHKQRIDDICFTKDSSNVIVCGKSIWTHTIGSKSFEVLNQEGEYSYASFSPLGDRVIAIRRTHQTSSVVLIESSSGKIINQNEQNHKCMVAYISDDDFAICYDKIPGVSRRSFATSAEKFLFDDNYYTFDFQVSSGASELLLNTTDKKTLYMKKMQNGLTYKVNHSDDSIKVHLDSNRQKMIYTATDGFAYMRPLSVFSQELLRFVPGSLVAAPLAYSLAASQDGRYLAVPYICAHKRLKVWSARGSRLILDMAEPEVVDNISAIAFSPDSKYLAFGTISGLFRVYHMPDLDPDFHTKTEEPWSEPRTRAIEVALPGHEVTAGDIAHDSKHVAIARADGSIQVLHIPTGTLQDVTQLKAGPVKSVALSQDHKTLFTLAKNQLSALSLPSGYVQYSKPDVGAIALSPDGNKLAIGNAHSSQIAILDIDTGREVLSITGGGEDGILQVLFSQNGEEIHAVDGSAMWRSWSTRTGRLTGFHTHVVDTAPHRFTHLARHPTQGTIIAGNNAGELHVYQRGRTLPSAIFQPYRTSPIRGMHFSPDGSRLLTVDDGATPKIWHNNDWYRFTSHLTHHTRPITWMATAPNGQFTLTASQDGTLAITEPR